MQTANIVAAVFFSAGSSQIQAGAVSLRADAPRSCADDGLIHADVSPKIDARIKSRVKLFLYGAKLRNSARLVLPCGFHVYPKYGAYLVLTNGTEFRRYRENNAFGFMPPFGFDEKQHPYQLEYETVDQSSLRVEPCLDWIRKASPPMRLCSGFGSATAFYGITSNGANSHLNHYVVEDGRLKDGFEVAHVTGAVESIFFVHSVDTPGGSITVIWGDRTGLYRTFVDVPVG